MATIGVSLILSSGVETLTLELYNAGTLLNTGGDALVEVGTSGYFEADVSESISITLDAVVKQGGTPIAGGILYLGQTIVGRIADLNSVLRVGQLYTHTNNVNGKSTSVIITE